MVTEYETGILGKWCEIIRHPEAVETGVPYVLAGNVAYTSRPTGITADAAYRSADLWQSIRGGTCDTY